MKKVLIAGGTGFLGQKLAQHLVRSGHKVGIVTRKAPEVFSAPVEFYTWQELQAAIDWSDIVINFCGESIAAMRWSNAKKTRLLRTRIDPAEQIVAAIHASSNRPELFIQGSATGYYGSRSDEAVNELSSAGEGFLASLAVQWEQAVANSPIRTIILRTGVVLAAGQAFLGTLGTLYAAGIYSSIGNSQQYLPWIHIDDYVSGILALFENTQLEGPVNFTAPNPCRFKEFEAAMKPLFGTQFAPPVPAAAMKLVQGDASSLILDSCRAVPRKLLDCGFEFKFNTIDDGIESIFNSSFPLKGCYIYTDEVWVPYDRTVVFRFFANAKNLEQITPPWLNFTIASESEGPMASGKVIQYRLKIKGIPQRWSTLITEWNPESHFVDLQTSGPYKTWHHRHSFESLANGTLIRDVVHYQLPLRPLSIPVLPMIQKDIRTIFDYRKTTIMQNIERSCA